MPLMLILEEQELPVLPIPAADLYKYKKITGGE
jgi:hypothetical protein